MAEDKKSDKGMINGGLLAVFIIGGAIVGNFTVFRIITALISAIIGGGIIGVVSLFIVIIIILSILLYSINLMTEVSAATYLLVLLCCLVFPLFGGIAAYMMLKQRGFTS